MLVHFKRYSVSFSRMAADIKHNINLTGFSFKYILSKQPNAQAFFDSKQPVKVFVLIFALRRWQKFMQFCIQPVRLISTILWQVILITRIWLIESQTIEHLFIIAPSSLQGNNFLIIICKYFVLIFCLTTFH